jgi:hypothetical protein
MTSNPFKELRERTGQQKGGRFSSRVLKISQRDSFKNIILKVVSFHYYSCRRNMTSHTVMQINRNGMLSFLRAARSKLQPVRQHRLFRKPKISLPSLQDPAVDPDL